MATMHDIAIDELILGLAEELKKMPEMTPPEWANFVKTGTHKERPPVDKDWWYMRAAAVLRTVAVRGPIGVSKLRSKYGGKKNRGVRPGKTFKGSGSIARKVLQNLQAAGLVRTEDKSVHKGRVITPEGIKLMNKVASAKAPAKKATPKKTEEKPKKEKTEAPKVEEKKAPEAKPEAPQAEETQEAKE